LKTPLSRRAVWRDIITAHRASVASGESGRGRGRSSDENIDVVIGRAEILDGTDAAVVGFDNQRITFKFICAESHSRRQQKKRNNRK
jgi:hypothetical protein